MFQFQYGAIKSFDKDCFLNFSDMFQFQYGAIKRVLK